MFGFSSSRDGPPGPSALFVEGALVTAIAGVFALKMFPPEASLVSVALAAMLTIDTVSQVAWRREGTTWGAAVRQLVVRLAALFVGATAGYAVLAALVGPTDFGLLFANQLRQLPTGPPSSWQFGSFDAILLSNLYVIAFFFLIGVGFRQGGVMLVVAWNASVWGAAIGLAVGRSAGSQGLAAAGDVARLLGGVGPHLLLEAVAYVTAGLSGVLLAKGAVRYHAAGDGPWGALLRTVVLLLLASALCILLGACSEAFFAGPTLSGAVL